MPTVDNRRLHDPGEERRFLHVLDQVLLDLQVLSQGETFWIFEDFKFQVSNFKLLAKPIPVLDRNDGSVGGRHLSIYTAPDDAG